MVFHSILGKNWSLGEIMTDVFSVNITFIIMSISAFVKANSNFHPLVHDLWVAPMTGARQLQSLKQARGPWWIGAVAFNVSKGFTNLGWFFCFGGGPCLLHLKDNPRK